MQNSGNQPGLTWVFLSLGVFSLSVPKFYNLGPILSKLHVTNLRDNWNWAGRKDTEIHGAAIRITTAVDVTLRWRQVTDTQSSNYRNNRGGGASQSAGSDCPLPLQSTKNPSHTKVCFILPTALWGKSVKWNESVWALLHPRFSQIGQSSDSLGKFCLHSPYKDSDLVS